MVSRVRDRNQNDEPMERRELSLEEAAEFLAVPTWTVKRWVRQGLLRGSSHGGGLRFERSLLVDWARRHGMGVAAQPKSGGGPPADMLADALDRGGFCASSSLETASDAITLAVQILRGLDERAKDILLKEVKARERMATTAIGKSVALPHPRRPPSNLIDEPVASLVRSRRPLDWAALDGEPVELVLLVAAPSVPEHLELLSRISFVLDVPECLVTLHEAGTREEITARLREMRMSK